MKKPSKHNKSLNEKFENFEFTPKDGLWNEIQNQSESSSLSLKDSFASFEFAPRKEAWNNIERILHPEKRRRAIIWWSAAAGIILLIGSIFFLSPITNISETESLISSQLDLDTTTKSNEVNQATEEDNFAANLSVEDNQSDDQNNALFNSINSAENSTSPTFQIPEQKDNIAANNETNIIPVQSNDLRKNKLEQDEQIIPIEVTLDRFVSIPSSEIALVSQVDSAQLGLMSLAQLPPSVNQNINREKRIGPDFSSLLASASTINSSMTESMAFSDGVSNNLLTTSSLATYESKESEKFETPLSFGIDFAYKIGRRTSILSGIDYTLSRSKISYSSPNWETKQNISRHYLGVPISLKFEILQKRKLNLFTSLGNQFDFGLRSKINTREFEFGEKISQNTSYNKLGNQSKVIAGIGVDYILSPSLDLHFEGTASYFYYRTDYNLWSTQKIWPGLKIGITYKL